jgi:toxin ParE1/3/4
LLEAHDNIFRDNPTAAQSIAQKVWDASRMLCDHPDMGRRGHVEGTREWVVSGTPYLIVYRVKEEELQILRVWHGRSNWQNNPVT